MSDTPRPQLTLTPAILRHIARYEITFSDFPYAFHMENVDITCRRYYTFTREDLICALRNIREDNPLINELFRDWLHPINYLHKYFHLDRAISNPDDHFDQIWSFLFEYCDENFYTFDTCITDELDLDKMISILENDASSAIQAPSN